MLSLSTEIQNTWSQDDIAGMDTEPIMAAAMAGGINRLYELIRENTKVLEKFDEEPFSDTPLHAAAKAGQTLFAMELMNLKPSLARKLDPDGYSPLHLALQKAFHDADDDTRKVCTLMAIQFVKADGDLVRVRGKEGYTPFLFIVEHCGDSMDLLIKFLLACPECMDDVTIRGETALHIAVRRDNFDLFEILAGWLKRIRYDEDKDMETRILNWEDHNGNTILHLAASNGINRLQFVKMLLNWGALDDIKNSDGITAAEVLEQNEDNLDKQTRKKLLCKIFICGSSSPEPFPYAKILKSKFGAARRLAQSLSTVASEGIRNALLVVVGLIATCTYQAVLDPPAGLSSLNKHGLDGGLPFWFLNGVLFGVSLITMMLLLPKSFGIIFYPILLIFSLCYFICGRGNNKEYSN